MQRGVRVIPLQGAIEKSPILLSQYGKLDWLDGSIIISYFDGRIIFSPNVQWKHLEIVSVKEIIDGYLVNKNIS